MARFILLFALFFVVELLVLIEIGSAIGALQCISLMFAAMVLGAVLVKLRAKALMTQMQESHNVNIKLLWLPLAGFLFIFPGFISDILAVLVLLPPVENFLVRRFAGHLNVSSHSFSFTKDDFHAGRTIDGECTVEEEIKFQMLNDKSPGKSADGSTQDK